MISLGWWNFNDCYFTDGLLNASSDIIDEAIVIKLSEYQ